MLYEGNDKYPHKSPECLLNPLCLLLIEDSYVWTVDCWYPVFIILELDNISFVLLLWNNSRFKPSQVIYLTANSCIIVDFSRLSRSETLPLPSLLLQGVHDDSFLYWLFCLFCVLSVVQKYSFKRIRRLQFLTSAVSSVRLTEVGVGTNFSPLLRTFVSCSVKARSNKLITVFIWCALLLVLLRLPLCERLCRLGVLVCGGSFGCKRFTVSGSGMWSSVPEIGGLLCCMFTAVIGRAICDSGAEICDWSDCACVAVM